MRSVRGKLLSSKEKKLFVRVVKSDVAFYDAKNFPPSDHFFTLLAKRVPSSKCSQRTILPKAARRCKVKEHSILRFYQQMTRSCC